MAVIREPNGVLRTPSYFERTKLLEIFYKRQNAHLPEIPNFLTKDEHVARLLEQKFYEYILDSSAYFLPPNNPIFADISQKVLRNLIPKNDYKFLDGTRHLGLVLFHLIVSGQSLLYLKYLAHSKDR